ncbi:DUF6065 family protein [Camelimonas abortus]|uniref:DUF6065 family protein n=1 Tax=Camelimonas abortus TaxID=1017184 RepID=A0ABV7LI56_9HYPH
MKLTGYILDGHRVTIRPAPLERPWMDATPARFAYRCLPLNIANRHGWEVLCPGRVCAIWDGGDSAASIRVDGGGVAVSHFGCGVLTFHVPLLFRTEPGYDLMVCGPVNRPKDGIAPLTGVIETDWAPYTFTMNWLFTRPGRRVIFEEGEPFCHFFPVRRGLLEQVSPALEPLAAGTELAASFSAWSRSRNDFNAGLAARAREAVDQGWQKAYFRGLMPDGAAGAPDHRSRLRLQPFAAPGAAAAPSPAGSGPAGA